MKEITGFDPTLLANSPNLRAEIFARLDHKEFVLAYLCAVMLLLDKRGYGDSSSGTDGPPVRERAKGLPQRQAPRSTRAVHRIILAVDIEESTWQVNSAKAELRRSMYELVEDALHCAGITEQRREAMVDRGDSLLALIHADDVPKSLLLDTVVPVLSELLAEHNADHPRHAFRLRIVVHAGEVHYDGRGWFGESLDIAFRLLDATAVKRGLVRTQAPTVLVISEEIHRSVVRHGYDGIDIRSFAPVSGIVVAGRTERGWLQAGIIR